MKETFSKVSKSTNWLSNDRYNINLMWILILHHRQIDDWQFGNHNCQVAKDSSSDDEGKYVKDLDSFWYTYFIPVWMDGTVQSIRLEHFSYAIKVRSGQIG